jgi:hypothetical protein
MPANEVVQHDSSGHMAYPAQRSTADVYRDRCMEIDFSGKLIGLYLDKQVLAEVRSPTAKPTGSARTPSDPQRRQTRRPREEPAFRSSR